MYKRQSLDYLASQQIEQLFRLTCQTLKLKPGALSASVRATTNVTPGDFASLARQHRFSPFLNSRALANALVELCSEKLDRPSSEAIGFKVI